jgi:hypothetical protein
LYAQRIPMRVYGAHGDAQQVTDLSGCQAPQRELQDRFSVAVSHSTTQ